MPKSRSRNRKLNPTPSARQLIAAVAVSSAVLFALPRAYAQGVRPSISGPALVAPLWLDGAPQTSLWVFPDKDASKVRLSWESMRPVIENLLLPDRFEFLRSRVSADGVLSIAQLKAVGLQAEFDERELIVKIEVPSAWRRTSVFDFTPRRPPTGPVLTPSPLSGYINFRGTGTYGRPNRSLIDGWQPFRGSADGAINLHGAALVTGYDLNDEAQPKWRRLDTRLVYDWPSTLTRGTLGDLETTISGFQAPLNLGGISMTYNSQLQPYATAKARSRTQIEIRRTSTVDVRINGVPFTRLRVNPGVIDLSQLPLASGTNHIVLVITDDLGQVETIDLNYLFDASVLDKGQQEFAYHIGFQWTYVPAGDVLERAYDTEHPTASIFHRYGLTDHWTLGAALQGDSRARLIEVQPVRLTSVGVFDLGIANSSSRDSTVDWGGRLRYRTLDQRDGNASRNQVRASLDYRGRHFSTPDLQYADNAHAWSAELQLHRRLRNDLSIGIGGSQAFHRDEGTDRKTLFGDLNWNITPNLQTGVTVTHAWEQTNQSSVFATLTWQESGCCSLVSVRHDSLSKSTRVDWERRSPREINAWNFNAGLDAREDAKTALAGAAYRGQRGELGLRHDSMIEAADDRGLYHETSVSAATALVWTRDSVALSRPVSDSFVIFPIRSALLEKGAVNVNPADAGPTAIADLWGPAVLPDLVSYYDRPVSMTTGSLPQGVRLKTDYFTLRPTYRSGISAPLEVASSVAVRGTLQNSIGAPIALASGEVRRAKDGKFVSSLFTNRNGRFLAEGLEPGSYDLVLFDETLNPARIEIRDGVIGAIDLGEPIRLEEKK